MPKCSYGLAPRLADPSRSWEACGAAPDHASSSSAAAESRLSLIQTKLQLQSPLGIPLLPDPTVPEAVDFILRHGDLPTPYKYLKG